MSSIERSALLRTFLEAGIGPVNMITGSSPASARAMILARGLMPNFFNPASLTIIMAAAPSQI